MHSVCLIMKYVSEIISLNWVVLSIIMQLIGYLYVPSVMVITRLDVNADG